MGAVRVFDSDFARDRPEMLIRLAEQALDDYEGNWDAMIGFQTMYDESGRLDAKQARQVLNMVLSDSRQQHLWREIQQALSMRRHPTNSPRLQIVRDKPPAKAPVVRRELRSKIKARFTKPKSRMGVIHRVNREHRMTKLDWRRVWRNFGPYDEGPLEPYFIVHSLCGQSYGTRQWRDRFDALHVEHPLLYLDESQLPDVRRCARCEAAAAELGIS